MNNNLKALIIQPKPDSDVNDIAQIAKAEGMKIFLYPNKIRVLEILHSKLGFDIAVVQNGDGCIPEKLINK